MDPEKRIRMAVESILENESLREGLEDEAASALLDWGMERAKAIAAESASLQDETLVEEAFDARMRALREILRIAVRICVENIDYAERDALLKRVADLLPLIYGEAPAIPETSQWDSLFVPGSAREKIITFRNLLENNPSIRKGD